ncbi:MAG: cysteine desulfurase family protein, partial [Fidelibacterota bacterium]
RNHSYGWDAADAVEIAREQVADLVGCDSSEIIFTSGATEADNLAITGTADHPDHQKKNHIITVKTEHKAILDTCHSLEKESVEITYLEVNADGLIDLKKLENTINARTLLVSVMHGNNEIGVIHPIDKIAGICTEKNVIFHTDAAQTAGKIPINFSGWGIDLMSISAHKMYGPKGVGALLVRKKNPALQIKPLQFGGGHERGFRSGTLPVPLIAGFGKACEIAKDHMVEESKQIERLRDRLLRGIRTQLNGTIVNGSLENRLPGNLNFTFEGVNAEALIMSIPEISLSTGSACTSSTKDPSYVLKSLGLTNSQAFSSVRIGIGRFNTEEEIDYVITRLVQAVERIRG